MRTRKKKWTVNELAGNPLIKRELPALFYPVHLELGCGKGRFITQTAALNPDMQYVAIERDPTILAAAARAARENNIKNIIFMEQEADKLMELFEAGSIQRLYINFCDPWPRKKKWAKRRLTHENYLRVYEALAIPEIHFKTDNRILFEFSIESLSARGWRLANISLNLHQSGFEQNIMTEYEMKFSGLGLPIYRFEAYYTC